MPRHPFDRFSHLMPKATDPPHIQTEKALDYFAAIGGERVRLAMDSATTGMPRKSEWDFHEKGPGTPQATVGSRELTEDDEEEGLSPQVIEVLMAHAKANFDEQTCAMLEKYLTGGTATDEPPDFPGQPKTGGTMNPLSDDALIDELRAQGRIQDAKDAGGLVQTSRNRATRTGADRARFGQDELRKIAMDSKDGCGGLSYSDLYQRGMRAPPRQGNSSRMAMDNRQRQLREYGSHSASDFRDSPSFYELFPDAARIKTV